MRVIFPVRDLSSKVHSTGQDNHILKSFENNGLDFCLANPFLDTCLPVEQQIL
jgi:hypothetical protein